MSNTISSEAAGAGDDVAQKIRRRMLNRFSIMSVFIFAILGPVLVITMGLSLAFEITVVIIIPAVIGGLGAYVTRPAKFRKRTSR